MTDLFSLGHLYPSDFLREDEQPRSEPVELKLVFDPKTSLVHLAETADPAIMYGRYWYRSGTNATMTNELAGIVESIRSCVRLDPGDIWVDIASNDGTLLSNLHRPLIHVGIDPADDTFRDEAERHADLIIQEPFSLDAWNRNKFAGEHARVITCIAMFYDLADPHPFLIDVHNLLERDGLFVLQMSYTPLMLAQTAFDNICHEHVHYYTLETISHVLAEAGFKVVDCQLNDVNGGSFRIYAMRDDADQTKFATQPHRDVCRFRVESLLAHEKFTGANSPAEWKHFYRRIERLKADVVGFIERVVSEGATVWGYGASTKGATLLQYFGLDHTLITGIAERSPYKYGLRTIGSNIPIYTEEQMRAAKPDYLLVMPWHFVAEFREREHEYLANGGRFIIPCPKFQIVSA